MAGEESKLQEGMVALSLRWGSGAEVEPVFVDQLHAGRVGDMLYLTFGQARLPIAVKADARNAIEIRPMVRLVIHRRHFEQFMEVFRKTADDIAAMERKAP